MLQCKRCNVRLDRRRSDQIEAFIKQDEDKPKEEREIQGSWEGRHQNKHMGRLAALGSIQERP